MTVDHFIAPKMVVFDSDSNGYRSVILSLAYQDDMVRQAVLVVSGFHLSRKSPHFRLDAEIEQQALLSRLYRNSQQHKPEQVLNMSSWATILVLLVGETITGSNNYIYLLDLLSILTTSVMLSPSLSGNTKTFIQDQARM